MDKVIGKYPHVAFGELNYCYNHDILYQRDMTVSVEYGKDYFEKYIGYEDKPISLGINKGRVDLSHKYCKSILDIGIGSGEFIKKSTATMYGFDINPVAIEWLKERNMWVDPYEGMPESIEGVTMWDALEHVPKPTDLLEKFRSGTYVFISLPIFDDLTKVRFSKHYKPNEHYYYYTVGGLKGYLNDVGFDFVEISDTEMLSGRENILAFAFKKR
jgi:hypothetical protein